VYVVWCIVYGVWCMMYGVWCMVYGCPWITWGPSAAIPPSKRATSGQFGQSLNAAKRLLESLGIKKTVIKANRVSRLGGRDLSWFLLLER